MERTRAESRVPEDRTRAGCRPRWGLFTRGALGAFFLGAFLGAFFLAAFFLGAFFLGAFLGAFFLAAARVAGRGGAFFFVAVILVRPRNGVYIQAPSNKSVNCRNRLQKWGPQANPGAPARAAAMEPRSRQPP